MENVMVPRDPTSEILIAMADAIGCTDMLHDRATESPLDAAAAAYKAILPFAQAAPTVEQEPVAWMCYFERDSGSHAGIEDRLPVITKECANQVRAELITRVEPLYAHPSPPADKQAAQEGETPRTDAETIALLTEKLNHAVSLLMYAATSEDFDGDDCMQVANQIQSELVSTGKTSDWHRLTHWYDRFADAMGVSNEDEIDIYAMVETRLRELSTTPSDIFEKCAVIGEEAMCACCWGEDANEAVKHVVGLIRAEALKVMAGGR